MSSRQVSRELLWCLSPRAVLIRVRAIASDVGRSVVRCSCVDDQDPKAVWGMVHRGASRRGGSG